MASLSGARRIVVKIGSALLVDRSSGALRADWLQALAQDVAWLRGQGSDVIVVSSGSIALGRRVLQLDGPELALEQSQAAAAVGQIRLARAYEQALAPHGIVTAQVLVTLEDSTDRRRYLNSRATLETLLGLGVVPIVNENDTIATDEIRYGDNDRLAAQVAVTVGADILVLLSDVDGLFTGDPRRDATAERLAVVREAHGLRLFAWVVMPEHVHLLIRPTPNAAALVLRKHLQERDVRAQHTVGDGVREANYSLPLSVERERHRVGAFEQT